jgi:UDP-N-acetyl-D-mannosaminuronic acid dehydrogenase
VFKLTNYDKAYEKADIVAFLVAHKEFKDLPKKEDKILLDFCGIYK